MGVHGIFVGLCTIDVIHRAPGVPASNEKMVAQEQLCVAGGPATNAAVTFAHLGEEASLVTALGAHPMTQVVRDDLSVSRVELRDLVPMAAVPPTISSIIVTASTGERAVVSTNATRMAVLGRLMRAQWLDGVGIMLVDGHHMAVAITAARKARARGIPVVLDGGSWKKGMEMLLPYVDMAICSERFCPPGGVAGDPSVLSYLHSVGVGACALTRGPRSILYRTRVSSGELPVAHVRAKDTLGAGDIFHGAFCAFITRPGATFAEALCRASRVASESCRHFGTRAWMGARRAS